MSQGKGSLQERVLLTCFEFIESDDHWYTAKKDEIFYIRFKQHMEKGTSLDSLLKRGSLKTLHQQWQSQVEEGCDKKRELSDLLRSDEAQRISVNELIARMKKIGKSAPSFSTSPTDVWTSLVPPSSQFLT